MACFIVPTTEAIVTTIVTKIVKTHEAQHADGNTAVTLLSAKLGWLNKMLWGGSALLAFEHIWHGELAPFYPFLTGAASAAEASAMLHEMATSGVAMALLVTAVWGCLAAVVTRKEKKHAAPALEMHSEAAQS